jgi:hypothetical protein
LLVGAIRFGKAGTTRGAIRFGKIRPAHRALGLVERGRLAGTTGLSLPDGVILLREPARLARPLAGFPRLAAASRVACVIRSRAGATHPMGFSHAP